MIGVSKCKAESYCVALPSYLIYTCTHTPLERVQIMENSQIPYIGLNWDKEKTASGFQYPREYWEGQSRDIAREYALHDK